MYGLFAKYYRKMIYAVAVVVTTLIFFCATTYLQDVFSKVLSDKNHAIGVERMINLSHEMVKDYDIIFQHTQKLATYVEKNPDAPLEEMENFVKTELMPRDLSSFFNRKNTDFVYAYVIAPEDSISVTYPLNRTNSPDIAYFNDSTSMYYNRLAKNNPDDVVVQGPLISPRTHRVLVYNRRSIFIDGKYWGYVGLCADFYKFLECVRLNVEDELFVYGVRSSIYKGKNDFIWGDNKLFKTKSPNTRQKSLFFGKQRWDLALKVKEGELSSSFFKLFWAVMFVLYCISLVAIILGIKHYFTVSSIKAVDILTGTANHEIFTNEAKKKLAIKKKEYGLVILELIHFKQVNTVYGYHTGDEILVEVTKRLHSVVGYNDKICRLGSEFIILLDNIKSSVDVEKICSNIEEQMINPLYVNNYSVVLPIIIGSSNTIDDGRSYKDLAYRAGEILDRERRAFVKEDMFEASENKPQMAQ